MNPGIDFPGLLHPLQPFEAVVRSEPVHFRDLQLDRIVADACAGFADAALAPVFWSPQSDPAVLQYRQAVMQALETPALAAATEAFCHAMAQVQAALRPAPDQPEARMARAHLAAAQAYCRALAAFAGALQALPLQAAGWCGWRDYLQQLLAAPAFIRLRDEADALAAELGALRYEVLIEGNTVSVRASAACEDYAQQLAHSFARVLPPPLRDGQPFTAPALAAATNLDPVETQILRGLTQLFPALFVRLAAFRDRHADFVAPAVLRCTRDLDFYRAWLGYIAPLRARGLPFCYPLLVDDKAEAAGGIFDLALASKLAAAGLAVVRNDYQLTADEHLIVVTGPNQAGKTTFARAFGQLHHLAALGCAVPGEQARLLRSDAVFTHFEREENFAELRSRLEDDLLRLHRILEAAGPRSVVILNEVFASTTLLDATDLSRKALAALSAQGVLALMVTFIDSLASFSPATLSLVGVMEGDAASRTYRFRREPADGRAYAMALAEKHGLSYARIKERLAS